MNNTINYSELTNDPIEGINKKIVLFSNRNFTDLSNRIILCSKFYMAEPKKETKQHKVAQSLNLNLLVPFNREPKNNILTFEY